MPLNLTPFQSLSLDEPTLATLIDEHRNHHEPRFQKFWNYYRNPSRRSPAIGATSASDAHPAREHLAQHAGLPKRLQHTSNSADPPEVVIENDIAWRIDALVDFVFGKSLTIESTAPDPIKASIINRALRAVLEANNTAALFQDLALLASVHGHIDLLLRTEPFFERIDQGAAKNLNLPGQATTQAETQRATDRIANLAASLRIDLIDATRAIPILDPSDYRVLRAHIAVWNTSSATTPNRRSFSRSVLDALRAKQSRTTHAAQRDQTETIEIRSAELTQRYHNHELIHESPNRLGVLPIVHIQNASQPYRYTGLSDVEPLIPLQNELNTRLSDRAHRVTMQSFKMFLAKGIEGFDRTPIAPGQVWIADDPDASIEAFGGDAHAPSEDAHIQEIRDALDKASGVSPVVLGVIRERLGHLSSENALRVTLMGVLSKTARKRTIYGHGIQRLGELILLALDTAGVLPTTPEERRVNLRWPDPLPLDERDRIRSALLKRDLGVPTEKLLKELGYTD